MFRAAIVPAIAVCLSLFFSLLSVGKLFSSLAAVAASRMAGGHGRRGGLAVAAAVYIVPIWVLCQAPFMVTNQYAEAETWRLLSEEARRKAPVLTVMSEYVLRMEPILAAVGYPLMAVVDPFGLRTGAAVEADDSGPQALTKDEVRELQSILGVASDGIAGPITRRAVASKQGELGLEQTGIATKRLLQLLRTRD